jgi:hypothetical protein
MGYMHLDTLRSTDHFVVRNQRRSYRLVSRLQVKKPIQVSIHSCIHSCIHYIHRVCTDFWLYMFSHCGHDLPQAGSERDQ